MSSTLRHTQSHTLIKQLIEQIIAEGVATGASDVHLSPNHPPIFRIAGQLRTLEECSSPVSAEQIAELVQQLASSQTSSDDVAQARSFTPAIETKQQPAQNQQMHFTLDEPTLRTRVRVTAYSTTQGQTLALRLLSQSAPVPETIMMPEFLRQISPFSSGLVLVTGPTGSGKSTTLASWIAQCSKQFASHIITIEDPIEYVFAHGKGLVHQCELSSHFGGYHDALTDILRRDPDVVMLGELRDLASVELALRAAETGHLVLGTLHSANAVDAVSRMVDIFPAQSRSFIRHMLSAVLLGVVSQRLVPSSHAKAKQGRIANYEVLTTTTAVKHLISEQKEVQLQAVMQTGAASKMFTFEQHRQGLIENGWISPYPDANQRIY